MKHKADMAKIKGNEIIENARDQFDYAERKLKEAASFHYQLENATLKRHIFLRRKSEQGQALQIIYQVQREQEHSQYHFNWRKKQSLCSPTVMFL